MKEIQAGQRRLNEHFRLRQAWAQISALPPTDLMGAWESSTKQHLGPIVKIKGGNLGKPPSTLPALFPSILHTQGLRYS